MPSQSKAADVLVGPDHRPLTPSCFRAAALAALLCACGGSPSGKVSLDTTQDSTLYAVGLGLAGQFNLRGLFTEEELAVVNSGFKDAILGSERIELEGQLTRLNQLVEQRRQERSDRLQADAGRFLQEAAREPGAVTTASGLVYLELRRGTGPSPAAADSVAVHYTGSFADGTVFDSSVRRGRPVNFRLDNVIRGWQEGLQRMQEGGKARLVIPPALAYGERGQPPSIPPNVPLVFDVELLQVHPRP